MKYYLSNKYYHLVASLPELEFGKISTIDIPTFIELVRNELRPCDQDIICQLMHYADIEQILRNQSVTTGAPVAVHRKKPRAICDLASRPQYLTEYLNEVHDQHTDKVQRQKKLLEDCFAAIYKVATPNIKQWVEQERAIRNIIAYKYTDNPQQNTDWLIYGGFDFEHLAANLNGIKELGYHWTDVNDLINALDIVQLVQSERELDLIRWKFIDELMRFEYFSIDIVAAYALRLQILDRWQFLNYERGTLHLADFVNTTRMKFKSIYGDL